MAIDLDSMSSAELRAYRKDLRAKAKAERARQRAFRREERSRLREARRNANATYRAERSKIRNQYLNDLQNLRANRGSMSPEEYNAARQGLLNAYKTSNSAARQVRSDARTTAKQSYTAALGASTDYYKNYNSQLRLLTDDANLRFQYARGNERAIARGQPQPFASYQDYLTNYLTNARTNWEAAEAKKQSDAQALGQTYTPQEFTNRYLAVQQAYQSGGLGELPGAFTYTPQAGQVLQQATVMQEPVQQAPVQQAPVQQAPVQQAPVQQAPVQQAPGGPLTIAEIARRNQEMRDAQQTQTQTQPQYPLPNYQVLTPQQQLATMLLPQIGYANQNYQQPMFDPFAQQNQTYNPNLIYNFNQPSYMGQQGIPALQGTFGPQSMFPASQTYSPQMSMYDPYSNPYYPPTGPQLQLPQEQRQGIASLPTAPQGYNRFY